MLLAILLSKHNNLKVTVLEKSSAADPWSSRSYSINLNPRGLSALDYAGVLEDAKAKAMCRHKIVLESATGDRKVIPKNPPTYAFTRPDLIDCLETIAKNRDTVTIQRGVAVKAVEESEDGIQLSLDNGSTLSCSHLVGADGKWSAVRTSMSDWNNVFEVQSEPAFGVSITPAKSPERWETDATTVFRSNSPKYYIIAAPLANGQYSVSMVCFEEIKEEHPWLVPRDDDNLVDWESEYGALTENSAASDKFQTNLSKMLEEELPAFYQDIQGSEGLKSVRVNRRTSWLKPLLDNPSYCSHSGRVVILGDAAHAMTPSIGEGCNCALESVVSLVKSLPDDKDLTLENLTQAFRDFGAKRPSEVVPIQTKSAAGNRYKKPEAPPGK